ncbi:transposase [Kitasatospora sp. NPDC057015]|uniref:transposase n=1 Tax=Kitasatospora sp. NPDC057015 TaxID=3346001 RepID=UPI00362C9B8D
MGLPEVPEQTALVAAAAFPKGTLAMRVREKLAEVFADEPFAPAFGVRGAPGLSPGMLALVTVLQFAENLTDRQAAAMAVRAIDWKYAVVRHEAPSLRARVRDPCRWSVAAD